jgi:glycosyltransferase involved in cell wall biosynthesis
MAMNLFSSKSKASTETGSNHDRARSVCLVTEELSGIGGSGGIGAAFYELALVLAKNGTKVDVLYCPVAPLAEEERAQLRRRFAQHAIKLGFLDESDHVDGATSYEKRSYAVYRHLAVARVYDFVHFHDYKGLGFFSMKAKKQGQAFGATTLVVQLHGPTRWTIEANGAFFVHEDQIKIDFLERESIADADYVVSPSAYLIGWLRDHGYRLPQGDRSRVIKNACGRLLNEIGERAQDAGPAHGPVTDLVLFARHEDRKGFAVFCDALDLAEKTIKKKNVTVSLLGKFGSVDGQPSGVYLIDRAKKWSFDLRVRTGLDRTGAAAYMASLDNPVVVVPSPYENSPYTVLEVAALGLPLISSTGGGGRELLAQPYPGLCDMTADMLAERIVDAVENGLVAPSLAEALEEIESKWLDFHAGSEPRRMESADERLAQPKVALAITHFERPHKLVDALISAARQTYKNLEIIVVDDGSSSEASIAALQRIEVMAERLGARLIRRDNGYLGAARNTAAHATDAEYICFLDDDDYAFPEMIEKMVAAATHSGADVTNCLNVYMPESERGRVIASLDEGGHRPSYVPMGGPLALASIENCLGAATALIRTASLRAIGGYTEIKGVGHEDYELFLRMLQAGYSINILPEPLYFYEVGRPSMLSRTSMTRNFKRCFDALEFGAHQASAEAAKDILSLALGKKLVVDVHNRQWWLYSQGPTAESRHQLMSHALTREERIRMLIALAQNEGSPKLGLAFAEDLQSSGDADADAVQISALVSLAGPSARSALPVAVLDPALVDVRADAELGRHHDAIAGFQRYIEGTKVVQRRALETLSEVLGAMGGAEHRQEVVALIRKLGEKPAQRDAVPLAREFMAFADALDGRLQGSVHLRHIIESDEQQYLVSYPDVAGAVEGGQFRSGYEHFAHFGSHEGRRGYRTLSNLGILLRRHGVELDLAALAAG